MSDRSTRMPIHAVSATIKPTGFQPTSTRLRNEVFMPRAEIAVTRHQLETLVTQDTVVGDRPTTLLTMTRIANPTRKNGIGGRLALPAPAPALRTTMTEIVS